MLLFTSVLVSLQQWFDAGERVT